MHTGNMPVRGIKFDNLNNQSDLQAFIKKQIYTKGFQFGLTQNANSNACVLGGKARWLHGICLFSEIPTDNDLISLNINQELVIDNVLWKAYNPQEAEGNVFKKEQFFALPRPLSGSDSVTLDWNALNAKKVWAIFYLSETR